MQSGDIRLYHSPEVKRTISNSLTLYIFRETGLTASRIYNENDYNNYMEASEEMLPEELREFLKMLYKLPAKPERELGAVGGEL